MKLLFIKIWLLFILVFLLRYFLQQNIVEVSAASQVTEADSVIVGKVGENIITRKELEQRMLLELQPDPYKMYTEQTKPPDANYILLQMLGEKALVTDARKQGIINDEMIQRSINDFKKQQILRVWVSNNLTKEKDKIVTTEKEIDEQIKANPKMDREQAKASVQSAKATKILDQIYEGLYKKSDVKKLKENYQKAIEIHDRLLNHPGKPETVHYIREYQIREELTQQEKNIVLATFTGGKVTLKDWFETLCNYSPPSRPQDLNTEKGIEQILDNTLTEQVIVADAKNLGLDKDPAFVKQIKDSEDNVLLNYTRQKKFQEAKEPAILEILAFYNNNKGYFTPDRVLIIDQIWCKDMETAQKVKSSLDKGKNFDEVKKGYSLFPESLAYNAYPGSEGFFWNTLWAGEPNNIIGPVKGFRSDGVKLRIVKIIEKRPGKEQNFTPAISDNIKMLLMSEQSNKNFRDTCLEALKKYPYEIYSDKIKYIDLMK